MSLADLRDPKTVLAGAARTLDLTRPIAVTMLGVLWHVLDDGEAQALIDAYVDPLPSGSHLAVAHPTIEVTGERMAEAIRQWNKYGTPPGTHRTPAQIASLFHRLELVEPGVVSAPRWRPEVTLLGEPAEMDLFCAVGRKP